MSNRYVLLDRDAIVFLIRKQNLKRWWVAEFTGVHKTTLRRWLSGQIAQVRDEHAEALASLLCVDRRRILRPAASLGPVDCE